MPEQSILVIEDDLRMGPLIVSGLIRAGLQAQLALDARNGTREALTGNHGCVILDLGLPDQDGFTVLEALRFRRSLAVLVLTARQTLESRLRAFELGAVDWMGKPFFFEELLARVKLRLGIPQTSSPSKILRRESLRVNLDSREASLFGEVLPLTPIEFSILAFLMERAGRAISRQQLMDHVLEPGEPRSGRTVDSHVSHLRQKLGAYGARVVTVWGLGYRFDLEERSEDAPLRAVSRGAGAPAAPPTRDEQEGGARGDDCGIMLSSISRRELVLP